jgi:hypothetical protein
VRPPKRFLLLVLALASCLSAPSLAEDLAQVHASATAVRWDLQKSDFEKVVLTISQPDGRVIRQESAVGQPVSFDMDTVAQDGVYIYELRGVPRLDAAVRRELAVARQAGNELAVIQRLRDAGRLPTEAVQSGSFTVHGGSIVTPDLVEQRRWTAPESAGGGVRGVTAQDQVFNDDLIVRGSACVGTDCVNGETFGLDTIKLKEISLQIRFEDTSTSAGFASNDWQLTANDSASGGANKFSIDDVTGAKVPFTILAGAANDSIFVDSTGRVGFRTATPVLDLHVNTPNTPAIRLEQNSSGGLASQTWDVAGNESGFFIRDVTSGSRLPLLIRPGAPTSSLEISGSGNVGIGTSSPSTKVHVRSGLDSKVLIENTNTTTASREMLEVLNNGSASIIFRDSTVAQRWSLGTTSSNIILNNQAAAGTEYTFGATGNLTISGTLTQGSDRDTKTDILTVNPEDVLTKLAALPIATWRYKSDAPSVRHLGPMAQDFAAVFGLGDDERRIAPLDVAGVSLAAVQALHQEVTEKNARIAELESRIEALERLIASLPEK